MLRFLLRAGCALLLLNACNFTKLAADQTVKVLDKAKTSLDAEHDIWLARATATGNLKFFEGVLQSTPENRLLLDMTAANYGLYAFAFIEDDLEQAEYGSPEYEELKARAADFYERARRFAIRRLELDFKDFGRALEGKGARLEQIIAELKEEHLAPMYWLAYAWGSKISVLNDDPSQLVHLGLVKRLMGWVRKTNGTFQNGGPHLFFGAVEVALPKQLGGRPELAKAAFEEGIQVTGGRFLMGKALYARMYMKAVDDKAGYIRLLKEVIDAPGDIMPSQRLANELAKIRARRWLAEADEIF